MSAPESQPGTIEKPVECPKCHRIFDYALYPDIRIPGNNKLKKKILRKEMFYPVCPYCGEEFKIKGECIYRDMNKKELYIVTESLASGILDLVKTGGIPLDDIKADDEEMTFFKSLLKKRVVDNVDAFREKILFSDCNYDDRIMELIKLSLSGILEKENHTPVYRIFLEDASGSTLEFTAFLGAIPPFETATIKTGASVYTYFSDKYLDQLGNPEDDEYILTDQKWARNSGLLKEDDAGFVIPM